jgi:hypothetical protein
MRSRRRTIALVLALAGAVAFAFAVQAAWWTAGEVSIGPFGARHCFGGECRETGLSWIGGTDLWMRAGVAARAGGYIAMFVLILLAGGLAAKRIPRLVARCSIVAILTAVVSGAYDLCAFLQAPLTFEGHKEVAALMMPALIGLTVVAFFVLRSQARTALRLDDADAALTARQVGSSIRSVVIAAPMPSMIAAKNKNSP